MHMKNQNGEPLRGISMLLVRSSISSSKDSSFSTPSWSPQKAINLAVLCVGICRLAKWIMHTMSQTTQRIFEGDNWLV